RRLPDGRAALEVGIRILRPGVVTELPRPRHGVEPPDQLARRRIVGRDMAADAHDAARYADDDHAVEIKRRGGDRIAFAPIGHRRGPDLFAGGLIERDEPRVEHAREDLAVAERYAAIRLAERAAGLRRRLPPPQPKNLAGIDV